MSGEESSNDDNDELFSSSSSSRLEIDEPLEIDGERWASFERRFVFSEVFDADFRVSTIRIIIIISFRSMVFFLIEVLNFFTIFLDF